MELWDILNENGEKTGETIVRGKRLLEKQYHLVVHIWIINNKGEFLISKRTPNKTFPNMWAVTGGSIVAGETSLEGAIRETKEELGVDLKADEGILFTRVRRKNDLCDVWVFKQDAEIDNLILQVDEVSEARWVTQQDIVNLIQQNKFVNVYPYLNDFFRLYSL